MANEEQLSILKQGVDAWNKWRKENFTINIDLSGANFRGSNLGTGYLSYVFQSRTDPDRVDLPGVNLRGANLRGVDFTEAILWEADFRDTDLQEARFTGADIRGANLAGANLTRAWLTETCLVHNNLKKSNLRNVYFGHTTFSNVDLSQAEWLEEAIHSSYSYISIDTIHNSQGKIPLAFFRGCGLSDLDIEFTKLAFPSLDPEQVTDITYKIHQLYLGGGIHYYSCFISYSSKDQEFAQRLHDDLQNNGVRCWFDREDLKIGEAIRPTIDRQIRLRDKLLVILSENSIKSEWVGDEVEGALEEEQKGNRSVLFPIRLDDTVLNTRDDWAAKIKRRRHIGDFSNWEDKNSYQKSFERLLRDLKATD